MSYALYVWYIVYEIIGHVLDSVCIYNINIIYDMLARGPIVTDASCCFCPCWQVRFVDINDLFERGRASDPNQIY